VPALPSAPRALPEVLVGPACACRHLPRVNFETLCPPGPVTENSLGDFGKLRTELHEIRERGYAVDREERRPDVVCLGAPIRDHSGSVVAALRLSGRKAKMTAERRQQLVPRLLEGANRISFRMGFHANAAYL
jgi:DNA-binding IclR family transcriptional regulator